MPPRKSAAAKAAEAPPSEAAVDGALRVAEGVDPDSLTVYQALRRVMSEVGHIAKGRRTDAKGGGPKFNFRGIDDVLNAVHDSFARWGIMVVPSGWEQIESNIGTTKSGTTQFHLRGCHTFTVYGPQGDHFTAVGPAEAQDLSDKASSKAMSMAYKYVVIQMLSIPVAPGALDDADQESTTFQQQPAQPQIDVESTWARYDQAIATLVEKGMMPEASREIASAKWREQQGGMSMEDFAALPIERVFGHIRQVVAYAEQVKQQGAQREDTNANADGDAAAGGE